MEGVYTQALCLGANTIVRTTRLLFLPFSDALRAPRPKMATSHSKPFDIAIVGGGIAGLTLAVALLRRKVPFTVYEAAEAFGEIGAGVGFEPCMVRVMDLIEPGMKDGFLRCANNLETDPPKWFDVRIGDRRKADASGVVREKNGRKFLLDEPIFQIPARKGPRGGVHRAHFLDELIKLLPPEVARFRKKLTDVTEAPDGSGDALLHFADGTTAQHTAVIGCDGIKARTRELVLGMEEGRPVFSGKYVYRGLIPMQKAQELLGEERPKTPQMYCGYRGHVLTFPIANGTIMNGKHGPALSSPRRYASLLMAGQWWRSAPRTPGRTPSGSSRRPKRTCWQTTLTGPPR